MSDTLSNDPDARLYPPARRAGLPQVYVWTWVGLASLSAAYLGTIALRAVDPARLLAGSREQPVAADVSAKSAAVVAEAAKLRQSLKDFQTDIGHLRADLESRGQDQSTVAGLSAIEERMSLETGLPAVRSHAPAPPTPPSSTPLAAMQPTPQPNPAGNVLTATATAALRTAASLPVEPPASPAAVVATAPMLQPFVLSPPALETGSIANPTRPAVPAKVAAAPAPAASVAPALAVPAAVEASPITFGPAIVKPTPKPFAVQLASGPTLDSIRLSWSLLSDQHADALRNLQPRFTAAGTEEAGQTFDLLAGPLKTAADAKKLCKALAARGTDCKVGAFQGEGL